MGSAGLNVKRAFTGLFDYNKYCIPSAIQDVGIILFHYHKDSFQNIKNREKHISFIPEAILIINHSYDLEPIKRKERFYADPDISARLKNQHIKAIDSIVIHALCQKILAKKLTKEDAGELIKNIAGVFSDYRSI